LFVQEGLVGNILKTPQSRVFTIEDRAGPAHPPLYQSLARAQAVSWAQGDVTPIRVPDPNEYGKFIVIDEITGQQGLPGLGIQFRMTRDLSSVLKLIRKGCPLDIQVHIGACKNPQDFNKGWDKIAVLEGARATTYGTDDLGALDSNENAVVNETIPFTGLDYYEIKRIAGAEIAPTQITQEVVDVAICDSRTCGECGIASDGCQRVFAVTMSAGGSPGLTAQLVYSSDQGATIGVTTVTTLAANEDPTGLACVGTRLVAISNESLSLHYEDIVDVLNGVASFTEMSTGFVAAKGPNAIFSRNSAMTWIVGNGGYVYFSSDITSAVTVQSAGTITTQNLLAIHGFDDLNLVAVGASNAMLVTRNGGSTWTSVTGPAVGVALNAVWMRSENEWFVGTAGGELWYTRDGGTNWTLKSFPNSGSGSVRDIQFSTATVGYMAHDYTPAGGVTGRILRTIDGGYSWYVLPEAPGSSMPENDKIGALGVCDEDPNLVFGGGLGANGTDGILVKAA
jgi:hypothetical protein